MKPILALVLAAVCAWAALSALNPAPRPVACDQLAYFSYLPALFEGRPFDLVEMARSPCHVTLTNYPATHRTVNLWGVGTAIGWLPFYLAADLTHPNSPHDSAPFWLACAYGTIAFSVAGLLLLYFTLLRRFPVSVAFLVCMVTFFMTPLIYYASRAPFFGHAFGFLLICCLLWLFLWTEPKRLHWLASGLVCGLLAATRPQLVLCAVLPFVLHRPSRQQALGFSALAFLAFLPQMVMWHETFGRWIVNPQAAVTHGKFFHAPAVWQVLFSRHNGLLYSHPVLVIGLLGLLSRRREGLLLLGLFVAQVVVNGMAADWWAGLSYGNRRFVEIIPFLSCGMAFALYAILSHHTTKSYVPVFRDPDMVVENVM